MRLFLPVMGFQVQPCAGKLGGSGSYWGLWSCTGFSANKAAADQLLDVDMSLGHGCFMSLDISWALLQEQRVDTCNAA